MKAHTKISLIGLLFIFIIGGCEQIINEEPEVQESKTLQEVSTYNKSTNQDLDYVSFQLYAGQNIDLGEMRVWNEGETLYVKYLTDGWCITETHLHLATSLEGIPQTKKGNPIPGKFEYKGNHECETEVTYTIDLKEMEWKCDQKLYIAAHAVVQKNGNESIKETAWGKGIEFPGNNWATYFNYTITCDDGDENTGALNYVAFFTECDNIITPSDGDTYVTDQFEYNVEVNYEQMVGNIKFKAVGDQLGENGVEESDKFIFRASCKNIYIKVETKNETLDTKTIRIGNQVVMDNGFLIKYESVTYDEVNDNFIYIFRLKRKD